MKVTGYIEEYGECRTVTLTSDSYQPSNALQKLTVEQNGEVGTVWAKLVAVEQPLFKD